MKEDDKLRKIGIERLRSFKREDALTSKEMIKWNLRRKKKKAKGKNKK